MFVVTLNKTSLKKVGAGALCCALVIFSAFLGRYISTRTVAVAAGVNRIESAQDIQTWFTGYGLDVDGTSITADKVKIPRKWDDSFSAFNGVVQQSGMDLTRYKGKTVEKWTALIPAASSGETSRYGVLLVYRKKAVGAYLLEKPSGTVIGLKDAQTAMAQAEQQDAQQVSGEDYSGDWMDLTRYKGKTVEKWTALIPAASSGETSRYGVLLVYRKKAVGAYLLEKPSGTVIGLKDAQTAMAQAEQQDAQQVSGEDYSGDWGERHDEELGAAGQSQQTSGEPDSVVPEEAQYTDLPLDAEGYPVE